jgi:hypothetical protein
MNRGSCLCGAVQYEAGPFDSMARCRNGRTCLRSLALLAALACAACGPAGSPEDELRALVEATEAAAEARDARELRALVADDYRDASGRDASDIRNFLHAWLVAHPSVNLVTRIDSIALEGTEQARVQVTVGMLGREANGGSDWDLAADIERLDIRLARDGGDWRVVGADRQSAR